MARIVKVTHVDKEKRTKAEPFAALHYDGSYASARMALGMIGVHNLDLPANAKNMDMDGIIDSLMDDYSNLKLPEILENEAEHLIQSRKLTLHVDSWLVLEVNPDNEWTEVVFYPDQQFNAKYEVVK